jgi:glyoxylate reductase
MMQKVLVTRELPEPGIALLQKYLDVTVNPKDAPMEKDDVMRVIRDKQGLVCLLTDRIDKEIIDAAPDLKVIANYAVGYDNIDIETATRRGICVTNTPDVLTETTADLTWALMLSISRRIVEADKYMRDGLFRGWEPMLLLGDDICGKTLGIIGLGRIGQAVARRAQGFNMQVLYYEPQRLRTDIENACQAEYRSLPAVLQDSDFVSIHVPLTDTTHHLIGRKELKIMKKSAYLINVSRGPVIDEKALVQALRTSEIAGCALDVYEQEPAVASDLVSQKNTILAPHIGSASRQTREKMACIAAENVIAVLVHHEKPPTIVNPAVYQ